MADRGGGMRASLSADDVGTPGKRPGKISANAIAKFESDLAIGGSMGAIHRPSPSSGHGSSSEMDSTSASHEHIQPYRPHSVQICEPDEYMQAVGGEREPGDKNRDKNEKKRKSIWNWNPLKKMRRFFSRKKSSQRTKSCEDLPTYRPKQSSDENLEKSSPVVRTSTMPSTNKSPSSVLKELKKRQASSHEEIRNEMSPSFASKTMSLPTLAASSGRSLSRDLDSTQEAGVSFESDPNSSSLEGLQAAHDKIKVAPKRRRPPTRNRSGSATSTLSADSPARKEQRTTHRRSKTDPKDITKDRLDNSLESSSLSDILSNTIFEGAEEEDEQIVKCPPSAVVQDDIMSRVEDAMSRTSGPSKLVSREDAKKTETSSDTSQSAWLTKSEKHKTTDTTTMFEVKKESKRYSLDEKTKKSFTDSVVTSKSESDILKAESSGLLYSEPPNKLWRDTRTSGERPSLTSTPSQPPDKLWGDTKTSGERPSLTSTPSQPPDKLWGDTKTSGERPSLTSTPSQPPNTADKKKKQKEEEKEKEFQEAKTTQGKQTQIITKPFKRGRSWSNNYKPKVIEYPIKHDNEEVLAEPKKHTQPASTSQNTDKQGEDTDNKDFRFSRTKSWSYGTKPADLVKANQAGLKSKENQTPSSATSEAETNDAPSWVAQANRMSKRASQLLQEDSDSGSDQSQTPTLRKSVKEPDKPRTSPKPVVKDAIKPQPVVKDAMKPKPVVKDAMKPKPVVKDAMKPKPVVKDAMKPKPVVRDAMKPKPVVKDAMKPKPVVRDAMKPKPVVKDAIKPKPLATVSKEPEPSQNPSKPNPLPRPKPSSFVRNSGSLSRITGSSEVKSASSSPGSAQDSMKKRRNTTEPKKTVQEVARSSFGNVKIDKCIVCGTTVYQMERCKFDDSVLHRNCIKCSVCKRHLTVGNFVMTESKIYCKPHSHTAVAVST